MKTRYSLVVLALLMLVSVRTVAAAPTEPPDPQTPRTFDVHWEPTPFPVFEGAEQPNPWHHRAPDDPAPRLQVDDPTPRWQVYEASVEDAPRLIYDTQRLPSNVEWDRDGKAIRLGVASQGVPALPRLPSDLRGQVRIDLASGTTEEILFEYQTPFIAPNGRSMAVQKGREVFLRQPGRPDAKLNAGARYLAIVGWTPDGKALLIAEVVPWWISSADPAVYLVPLVDGEARYAFTKEFTTPAWSHDGSQAAYTYNGDIYAYKPATQQTSRLTNGQSYIGPRLDWSDDDSMLLVGADLIDATTGKLIVRVLPPHSVLSHALSSDGRYFMATDVTYAYDYDGACPRPPSQNRTVTYDLVSGIKTTLRDCDGTLRGATGGVTGEWLLGSTGLHHAVINRYSCTGCDGATATIEVITLENRTGVDKGTGQATVSPDNRKLIVSGAALQVFSNDLELLREIPVPPGKRVYAVAWSPDSQRFVYTLGPRSDGP